jgi:multicomponent K+:H+ antiporter subunit D
MNSLIPLPIVVPAAMAALLLLRPAPLSTQRLLSTASTIFVAGVSVGLFLEAATGAPQVYAVGNWPAPFGIVLVVDRLAALMVTLTALLAAAALVYAIQGWDARGRFFHPLFQFQLMGLNGAFLTGDLFNLFVFFEVMLIASYCLMLQGPLGGERLRATFHYATINITASGAFLVAVSLLYGLTGTLNMAHLAQAVGELPPADIALARSAGLLLVGVFCLKAALFPLYFWLPAAYANAAAPVAALFAIMTKVGVYAVIRVTTLIFGEYAGAASALTAGWLLPVAAATLILAALGAMGAGRLAAMVAYLTVASVGTMFAAISAGGVGGLSAALYYLVHSTLAVGFLFLLVDLLARQRGGGGDAMQPGPALRQPALLGLAFVIGAATVTGVPPFSGFLGKLMVLRSVQTGPDAIWVWLAVLVSSFIILVTCARAGSLFIWNATTALPLPESRPPRAGEWLAMGMLLALGALVVALAVPLKLYTDGAAKQLSAPHDYIEAVMGERGSEARRPPLR